MGRHIQNPTPTEDLLNKWGHQNHTIIELYVLLYKIQNFPAMDCLKSYVPTKYHVLLDKENTTSVSNIVSHSNMMTTDNNLSSNIPSPVISIQGGAARPCTSKILNGPVQVTQSCTTTETPSESAVKNAFVESAGALLMIPYEELCDATLNWNDVNVLGKGGFGIVYKGNWKNTAVAIKKLKNTENSKAVSDDSLRELRYLNSCRHDNVLPLYGYSIGGDTACLVYQLMVGGSLEERLRCKNNRQPLSWKERLNIAKGVAKGLQFLHTVSKTPLIHGDIKSANILIDAGGEARIGDFGLARQGPNNNEHTHVKVSRVHGTLPYLPDEFLRQQKFSTKVDVYSFGIVLFEIVTGLGAYDKTRVNRFLKDHVMEHCRQNPRDTSELQDIRLIRIGEENLELSHRIIIVGVECVQNKASDRPHMVTVFEKLNKLSD